MAIEREFGLRFTAVTADAIKGIKQVDSAVGKLSQSFNKNFGKFTGPVMDLAFGGGIVIAAKRMADLDARMVRIGIDSSMTTKQVMQFKDQMFKTGVQVGASSEDMMDLSAAALKSSKDVKFVSTEMGFMAKVMKATGASGQEVGEAIGKIHEKTGLAGPELEKMVGTLYGFGKTTGRESIFKDIMKDVPKLLTTFKAAGGKDATKFLMESMFVDDPQAMIKAFRTMSNKAKRPILRDLGFDLSKGLPDVFDVVKKVMARRHGNKALAMGDLSDLFGKGAFNFEKAIDNMEEFDKAAKEADPQAVFKDAATAAETLASAVNSIKTAMDEMMASEFGKYLQRIIATIREAASDGNLEKWAKDIGIATTAVIGLWAALKAFNLVKGAIGFGGDILSILKGGKGGKGSLGIGQLGTMGNPMYVVISGNAPGGLPGLGGAGGAAGGTASALAAAVAVPVMAALGMIVAGKIGQEVNSKNRFGVGVEDPSWQSHLATPAAQPAPQASDLNNNIDVTIHNTISGEDVAGVIARKDIKVNRGTQIKWGLKDNPQAE